MICSSLKRAGTGSSATRAIARADGFGLRPPGGDRRGLFGMRGEPIGNGLAAVGGQFAVHIGVQLVLGYG